MADFDEELSLSFKLPPRLFRQWMRVLSKESQQRPTEVDWQAARLEAMREVCEIQALAQSTAELQENSEAEYGRYLAQKHTPPPQISPAERREILLDFVGWLEIRRRLCLSLDFQHYCTSWHLEYSLWCKQPGEPVGEPLFLDQRQEEAVEVRLNPFYAKSVQALLAARSGPALKLAAENLISLIRDTQPHSIAAQLPQGQELSPENLATRRAILKARWQAFPAQRSLLARDIAAAPELGLEITADDCLQEVQSA